MKISKKEGQVMEGISHKTLILLLIVAIIVSIASTIISINRVTQLRLQFSRMTGLATTLGQVNISLAKVNSIAIPDTQITFGSCSPNATYGSNLSSNISNSTTWESWGSPGVCNSFPNSPDNITIRNDGNANINISVKTNALALTFIGGADPRPAEMWFSVRNATDSPGCFNATTTIINSGVTPTGMQWGWLNMSTANENYLACANLTPVENVNSIYVFAKIFIPADVPTKTGANATLTFTATNW